MQSLVEGWDDEGAAAAAAAAVWSDGFRGGLILIEFVQILLQDRGRWKE